MLFSVILNKHSFEPFTCFNLNDADLLSFKFNSSALDNTNRHP